MNAEIFLKDQVKESQWSVFPTVLNLAYAAADDLVKDSPILSVESALANKGRLVSYAVDHALVRAIENGSIDADFRWAPYAKPTGKYLELRFSHSTASVSQVKEAMKQPRNVAFRDNAKLNNGQLELIYDSEESTGSDIEGVPHFFLVHGYQSLSFAHFGFPSSLSKTEYSWVSDNLMLLPHEIMKENTPTENTDYDLDELGLLKQDIERWRVDNNEEFR